MKVLFIDTDGVCTSMALQAQYAGHDCKAFISPQRCDNIARGLVPRVNDWRNWMRWADLIVMTGVGKYMRELDEYFQKGFPIMGTNWQAAQLEIDREVGMEAFERAGFPPLPYKTFHNYDEAIEFVKKNKSKTYVSKPLHDNADKSTSYVAKDWKDMSFMLEHWKKKGCKYPFILQEKIDIVGEVGVSGWFGPNGWCDFWEEDFEHKKLMAGNIGPNTGEMGNVCKYVTQSELAEDYLLPLTDTLHALGFIGNFAMGLLIEKGGVCYASECTARLGWPITFQQQSLHREPMVEWFARLLAGETKMRVRTDHCCSVVMGMKPFPYDALASADMCDGYPIWGITQENCDDVHLAQVKAGKVLGEDAFVSAGTYLVTCVGKGSNVNKACDRAMERVKELTIPNSPIYRNDIGRNLGPVIAELKKAHYAEEWENG